MLVPIDQSKKATLTTMSFTTWLVLLVSLTVAESESIFCNKSLSKARKRILEKIESGNIVFGAVSYSSVDAENNERLICPMKCPIMLYTVNETYPLSYTVELRTDKYTTVMQILMRGSIIESMNESVESYLFSSNRILDNEAENSEEVIYLNACRLMKDDHGEIITKKSFLILRHTKHNWTDVEVARLLKRHKKNITMTNFKLPEFQDEGFTICAYFYDYLNECNVKPNENDQVLIVSTALIILILICVCLIIRKVLNRYPIHP